MPGMAGHLTVRSMRWWTAAPPAGGLLGAVLVDDSITGAVRVFIGGAQGHDELGDAELIAQGVPPWTSTSAAPCSRCMPIGSGSNDGRFRYKPAYGGPDERQGHPVWDS